MTMKNSVIFLANGFEEIEALTVVDVLRRANLKCDMCSLMDIEVTGSHGITIKANLIISNLISQHYDCIILPGGMPGAKNLKENKKIISLVKSFNRDGKLVAAICAATIVLKEADIIEDKKVTSFPGVKPELVGCDYQEEIVVQDDNLITSRGPATALEFALKLVENLSGKEVSQGLREEMLVDFVENKIKAGLK